MSAILIALACLFAPLGALAAWARYEIADTARYEAVTAPLAADPAVRDAVAEAVAAGIMREVQVGPPMEGRVRAFTQDAVRSFTGTGTFRTAWETANRAAHDAVMRAVRGSGEGPVTLEIAPVAETVRERLAHDRVPFAHRIPVDDTAVTVLSADDLVRLRKGYRVLELTSFWLPSLAAALAAVGILVAACRRRALFAAGIGTALGGALLGLAVAVGRRLTLADLPPDVAPGAVAAVYDALTSTLRTVTWMLVTLGSAVALVAWLHGWYDEHRRTRDEAAAPRPAAEERDPAQV